MAVIWVGSGRFAPPPPPVSDADAQAYLTAVQAADGQFLEIAVRNAVNDFVIGCKADVIWAAIKALCILAGARTLAGALVPLVGTAPTNFNFVSGDYDRKTGLKGDGSTKYLNSNRNNNADPQNSKHIACYQSEPMTVDTRVLMGTSSAIAGRTALLRVGNTSARINANGGPSVSGAGVAGFIGGARASSSTVQIRNGGVSSSSAISSEVPGSENIGVFGTAQGTLLSNPRLAFYSIGEALDLALLDARVTTLVNAIATAIP